MQLSFRCKRVPTPDHFPIYTTFQELRSTQFRLSMDSDWYLFSQKWSPLEKLESHHQTRLGLENWNDLEQQTPHAVPLGRYPPRHSLQRTQRQQRRPTVTRPH